MKKFVLLCLPFVLAGCSKLEQIGIVKSTKVSLEGQRESVLLSPSDKEDLKAETNIPVVVPSQKDVKQWPQGGYSATHVIPNIKASSHLHPAWKKNLNVKRSLKQRLLTEPIVADGKLFIYTPDSYVSVYNAKTGESLWTVFLRPEKKQDAILGGGVAYHNNTLFVSTPFAELFAVDASTGKAKWAVKTSGPLRSAPTIADGRVYVITINNELYSIDQKTGKVIWSHTGIMEYAGLLGGSTPAVGQDVVIAPYTSGEVYALRVENGHPLWSESLASAHRTDSAAGMPHIHAKPVIDGGQVYVVSNAGRMAALNIRNGQIIWEKSVGGAQTPLVSGGFIYLVSSDNDLICMTKTGLIRWVERLPKWRKGIAQNSRIIWSGPIMVGSHLILAGSNGRLMAINAKDGKWAYEFKLPGKTVIPPIAANGMVYVVTDMGELVAFR